MTAATITMFMIKYKVILSSCGVFWFLTPNLFSISFNLCLCHWIIGVRIWQREIGIREPNSVGIFLGKWSKLDLYSPVQKTLKIEYFNQFCSKITFMLKAYSVVGWFTRCQIFGSLHTRCQTNWSQNYAGCYEIIIWSISWKIAINWESLELVNLNEES